METQLSTVLQTRLEIPCMGKLGFNLFCVLFLEREACGSSNAWPCITTTFFGGLEAHLYIVLSVTCARWILYPYSTFESGGQNYVPTLSHFSILLGVWHSFIGTLPGKDSSPPACDLSIVFGCRCCLSCPVYRYLSTNFWLWKWLQRE
jgi:hypothetical protein